MAYDPELDDEDEELAGAGAPAPIDTVAGPQTTRDQVMQRISGVRNPSSEKASADDSSIGADPDQRDAAMQFAKNTALTSGIGRALNTLAAGTGFKPDDSAYDALDKQPQVAMKDLDRSALVRRAIEARKGKEAQLARSAAVHEQDKKQQQANSDRSFALQSGELSLKRGEREDAAEERRNKASGDQFKVAGYGKRLQQAQDIFDNVSKNGYDRSSTMGGIQAALPSFLQGDQAQEQEQAERNFVNAVLRRESGAAIAPSEFASAAKQYFPRSGDSAAVLANKKANREQVLASLQAESGPAWEKIPSIASAPVEKKESGSIIPQAQADSGRGPKVGTVQDGYIYTGGAPDDPHSWVKAK